MEGSQRKQKHILSLLSWGSGCDHNQPSPSLHSSFFLPPSLSFSVFFFFLSLSHTQAFSIPLPLALGFISAHTFFSHNPDLFKWGLNFLKSLGTEKENEAVFAVDFVISGAYQAGTIFTTSKRSTRTQQVPLENVTRIFPVNLLTQQIILVKALCYGRCTPGARSTCRAC